MIARTTIAMDQELLRSLKRVSQEKKCRSLSQFIKDVLLSYLKAYQTKKLYKQMARDYQEYAASISKEEWKAFKEIEAMAWGDLNQRES